VVAEAVLIGPVSVPFFPANREKNREFRENRSPEPISALLYPAQSMPWKQIPYCVKQGTFSAEQAIVSAKQGSSKNVQRIVGPDRIGGVDR
jgi:hypothetical protein